ncbi:MAG TPA: TonB-dependent receptor, partial [Cyclobacteriaceae bacterium]|nr:TonB-dependent receptor [Cyclobacteriaceae bacterium]
SGKVTSAEDGTALPGVNVIIKGTTNGTATDAEGRYSISVPGNVTLQFTFIGLVTQEVEIGARNVIDIVMAQDAKQLGEVVVVGYGTQERAGVTGSISKVKGADIQNLPVTSYEQALQGRTPGVQISSPSGELGAALRIRVRGSASVTASNQPLVVIDGFIVTSTDQTNFTDSNAANPLADLNPNDIESIEVLKDASSAAIYGARGSNGVMIITTKRGGQGKTKFNLNYSTGNSSPTHLRKFLNGQQYAEMFSAAAVNAGYAANDLNTAWNDAGGGPLTGTGSFSDLVSRKINDNWNKQAFRTGRMSQYDFSAAGGNEKTQFFASLAYLDQDGIIIANSFQRMSGRFNLDHTVNSKIKIGASINQIYSKKNNVPENNSFGSPLEGNAIAPIIPLRDSTGDYNDNTFYGNPYRAIANFKDISTEWRNFSNLYGSWKIMDGLNFRSEAGVDFLSLYEYGWNGSKTPVTVATPSSGKYGTTRVINYNINNTLNYTKSFDKHNIEFLLGQSYQQSVTQSSFIQGLGLPTDDFKYLANASQNTSFNSAQTSYAYTSVFGRLHYKFNNKYLVSASLRNDGSSRFGKDKKYGWFPAASVGWILSEENFIKGTGISNVLNFLKLKSSIGLTGNSEIPNFASRGLYTSTYFGDRVGLYPVQLANNNLTWEKTTQWDLGVEYEIVNSRISGGVDYYTKNTNGLLLSIPIPPTSGYTSTLRNAGKMSNKGWDIYINTRNLVGKFKWSTSFNISTFKNKVVDLVGQPILPVGRNLNAAIEGQPIGVFYGVKYAGVDPSNGDALYYLADGTTTNNWSNASQLANYRVLGSPNPKHYGGITNTFEFMGFDLSIFAQWSYGNQIFNSSAVFQQQTFSNYGLDNQTVDMMNYWKKEGDKTNVPRPDLSVNNGNRITSRFISDGSYLRFKTVSLGYSIPTAIANAAKFNSIRIYATAQNLFTITNYKGNDPEVSYTAPSATTQSSNLANGVDYYSAPQAKSIIFGIKLGF